MPGFTTEIAVLHGRPDAYATESVLSIYREIFGIIDEEKFHLRMQNAEDLLILFAQVEGALAGFKVGYRLEEGVFYSWIGGVRATYRKHGIARMLMERQHEWCKMHNYRVVRTKTYNRWKNMLLLNLRCGFEITGTVEKAGSDLQIVLEKKLF